ncbi:MAG: outer membrane beta-barrel protein [Acidobacteria bacterium]|nr:outer membrane beta-barrel protein [Acidobacteriota bacterium]
MRITVPVPVLAMVSLFCLAAPVAAQDVPVEIAGGYAFVRFQDQDGVPFENVPAGWFASSAVEISDWLAIAGEVSGHYKKEEAFGFESDLDTYTFLGGVRYYRRLARLTPFGQFLVGGAWSKGEVRALRFMERGTDFAIQPGGGVDVRLTNRLSARAAAHWLRIMPADDREDTDAFRLDAGIVIRFGST